VRLVYLPTWRHKYFDTLVHTFLSTIHLIFRRADVALYCNAANAIFTLWPRLAGMRVALNVDGLERKRRKWNRLAKTWYLISERLATFCPNVVVTDAGKISDYYLDRYGKHSEFIPYGAELGKLETAGVLDQLGLERGRYCLYVSRLEPENNALAVREAFEKVNTEMKLALIGDAPYAEEYIQRVRATTDPRVLMPGAIYGRGYHELLSHCYAYIHATEVGGTHPALIEAMGRGAVVLYLNTPENAEVAGDAGIPFEAGDLVAKLDLVLAMPEAERVDWGRRAMQRVAERYSWDRVTEDYERLLINLQI
jgi:glycosyltransferase involved in cell wall biosynthesis